MGDQNALREAIQRARELAAKISQQPAANQPVKRPATTSDHSGPIKVTLAYEKPANFDANKHQNNSPSRQRSSSRDYNRNERDRDSRDYKDSGSYSRSPREANRNFTSNAPASLLSQHGQYENSPQPPRGGGGGAGGGGEEKIEIIIPHSVIGLVIGKGGENIKRIQNESGAIVRVDPNTIDERGNKLCTITGTKNAVEEARIQVENVIENSGNNKRPRMGVDGSDSFRMKIPASRTGAIIGKGGETIKSIKQQSGCDIELEKNPKECDLDESVFVIRGSQDKIMKARNLIEARLASRSRDGPMRDGPSDHHHHHQSGRSGGSKGGVITGANAAPVNQGQFSDMPSTYQAAAAAAAGQQNSADMTAAWAAYFAQYSSMLNQTGAQPGMPYAGQPNILGVPGVGGPAAVPTSNSQAMPQLNPQQPPAAVDPGQGGQAQADYSDQWIEYYLQNGRPDYAEQIMQMKKQQQAPKPQQQS